jgi:hypothetical protein
MEDDDKWCCNLTNPHDMITILFTEHRFLLFNFLQLSVIEKVHAECNFVSINQVIAERTDCD